ncbi:MAG: hypothetical protein ACLPN6_14270 [Streptosporangiaceae bacterium]|jgi:hypothetical protein|nr:hypothetical protein [Actinomycetota bacterium]
MNVRADSPAAAGAGLPAGMAAAVAELRQRPLTGISKGFGGLAAREVVTAASLAKRRPWVFGGDFTMPLRR